MAKLFTALLALALLTGCTELKHNEEFSVAWNTCYSDEDCPESQICIMDEDGNPTQCEDDPDSPPNEDPQPYYNEDRIPHHLTRTNQLVFVLNWAEEQGSVSDLDLMIARDRGDRRAGQGTFGYPIAFSYFKKMGILEEEITFCETDNDCDRSEHCLMYTSSYSETRYACTPFSYDKLNDSLHCRNNRTDWGYYPIDSLDGDNPEYVTVKSPQVGDRFRALTRFFHGYFEETQDPLNFPIALKVSVYVNGERCANVQTMIGDKYRLFKMIDVTWETGTCADVTRAYGAPVEIDPYQQIPLLMDPEVNGKSIWCDDPEDDHDPNCQ